MAAHYVEQIRTDHPNGPYHVGGYSFGGIIAYEIAQQLIAGGSEVALLAIIDRLIPDSMLLASMSQAPAPLDAEWSIGVMRLIESLWGVRIVSAEEEFRPFSVDELLERIRQTVRAESDGNGAAALRGLVEAAGEELLRNIFRVVEANLAASRGYSPRPYSGPITLFRAAERHPTMNRQFAEIFEDEFLGWDRLAERPVSVHVIPGDHFSMIAPPHVNVLAAMLQESLDTVPCRV
jgi:thioesterase domain-containing protein